MNKRQDLPPAVLDPRAIVEDWLDRFNAALADPGPASLSALFVEDSHWREVLALSWELKTVSGREAIGDALAAALPEFEARAFAIDAKRCPPRVAERLVHVVEAILRFETKVGRGAALLRIRVDEPKLAWTLHTTLEDIRGHEEPTLRAQREEPVAQRSFHGPNWFDKRAEAAKFNDREPAVLIVGGGHAGLTAAARLGQLGVDALVVDRMKRVGDNWRLRYRSLKLHNQHPTNHLPYIPYPSTWQAYLPKDRIANFLEFYVDAMDIQFWTETSFEGATYDAARGHWEATVKLADGGTRVMKPRHIVMATSVSGTPRVPHIPTLDRFEGPVVHSSKFGNGSQWRGKNVLVFGTGTSAHDIAQDLHGHGTHVSLIQRSPTLVAQLESAQFYEGVFQGEGPSWEDRDLVNTSVPLKLMLAMHKGITAKVAARDKPLLDALANKGFKLTQGVDDTGWPYLFRVRGGGYYFNVGCSDLIVKGEVGLIQYDDIESFTGEGAKLRDGRSIPADLIVLATGYMGQEYMVEKFFGSEVLEKVGQIWGFDMRIQELSNMWMRTGQPGLWFTGGPFSACRAYSKYLALQIKADELGLTK